MRPRHWGSARDERPWDGTAPPAAWYRFSTGRKAERTEDHLAGYKGWMHADGYAGFNELYRRGDVREVACMAHVRRKFVDVHKSQGSSIAEEAIGRIADLYAVEKEVRGRPPDERMRIRQAKASPVGDAERLLKNGRTLRFSRGALRAAESARRSELVIDIIG